MLFSFGGVGGSFGESSTLEAFGGEMLFSFGGVGGSFGESSTLEANRKHA